MTYKELTEKMSKENLSQMEGSDEMLRSAEGADMELAIDDLGLIAGGAGEEHMLRCSVCGQLDPEYMAADPSQYKGHKCYYCMMKEYERLVY